MLKRSALLLALLLVLFTSPVAGHKKRRPSPKPKPVSTQGIFTAADRYQMLHSFSDQAILTELERRWLMEYSGEELEREAKRRGIR